MILAYLAHRGGGVLKRVLHYLTIGLSLGESLPFLYIPQKATHLTTTAAHFPVYYSIQTENMQSYNK